MLSPDRQIERSAKKQIFRLESITEDLNCGVRRCNELVMKIVTRRIFFAYKMAVTVPAAGLAVAVTAAPESQGCGCYSPSCCEMCLRENPGCFSPDAPETVLLPSLVECALESCSSSNSSTQCNMAISSTDL